MQKNCEFIFVCLLFLHPRQKNLLVSYVFLYEITIRITRTNELVSFTTNDIQVNFLCRERDSVSGSSLVYPSGFAFWESSTQPDELLTVQRLFSCHKNRESMQSFCYHWEQNSMISSAPFRRVINYLLHHVYQTICVTARNRNYANFLH